MRHLNRARIVRTMEGMQRIAVVILVATATTSVAHADPQFARDNLLPLVDQPIVDMRPKTDHRIDILAAARERRHDRLWQAIDVTALALSTAALAWDWKQTRTWSEHNWQYPGTHGDMLVSGENNPILGNRPKTGTVDTYFAITTAANLAIWFLMPKKYRSALPAALLAIEAPAIIGNISAARKVPTGNWSCSMCGF